MKGCGKMKKLIRFAVCTAVSMMLLGIVGCGSKSAEDVVEQCIDCLAEADFNAMRQISTGGMIQWIDCAERKYDEVAKLLGEKKAKSLKETYDNVKYEIGDVADNNAEVTVPVKINGQVTPMTLVKQGENWFVEKFEFPIL